MIYRKFGNTDLTVSEIGFGAWAISGVGYGNVDDNESLNTLHEALENGINFIDTADSYGNGHSEELIGKVLSERNDNNTVIATKFGWDFYNKNGVRGNLSPDYIKFALDQSLKRLKRDTLDIYQIHSQKPKNIIDSGVFDKLQALREEGKIKYIGFSANYISDALEILENYDIDVLQISYNLLNHRKAEKIFADNLSDNIGIICREPLASGFLSGKYDRNHKFDSQDHRSGYSEDKINIILNNVEKFRFLETDERTLVQSALCFCLQNKNLGVVIPGIKNRKQLSEVLKSTETRLTESELKIIDIKSRLDIN